jgi:hypothetical protein
MADVFVLGAGSSKGIHQSMPLTRDLWDALGLWLQEAGYPVSDAERELFSGMSANLELWLSYLAQQQPFLTEVETMRNRARFLEVADALAVGISRMQQVVLEEAGPPGWLIDVEKAWHQTKAAVITLNYDTLIENAYWAATSREFAGLYQAPIAHINARVASTWGGAQYDDPSFRLLKLHGSVNWFQATQGPQAYYVTPGEKGKSQDWRPYDLDYQAGATRGLRRAIVPPILAKDPFLSTDLFTIQWQEAAKELRSAQRLWLLGYSMPSGDQTMGFLLANVPAGTQVTVAAGDGVAERVADRFPNLAVETAGKESANAAESAAREYVSSILD